MQKYCERFRPSIWEIAKRLANFAIGSTGKFSFLLENLIVYRIENALVEALGKQDETTAKKEAKFKAKADKRRRKMEKQAAKVSSKI